MNDETPVTPEYSTKALGKLLQANREDSGWSIEQVAETLKLSPQVVKNIESGELSAIASPVFAKGYTVSYAKLFNMDMATVDRHLVDAFPKTEKLTQEHVERIARTPIHTPFDEPKFNWSALLVAVGVAIVIAALVWWFLFKPVGPTGAANAAVENIDQAKLTSEDHTLQRDRVAESLADSAVAEFTAERQAIVAGSEGEGSADQVAEPVAEAELVSSQDEQSLEGEPLEVIAPAEYSEGAQPSATDVFDVTSIADKQRVIGLGENTLIINFNSDCWVQVEDDSGRLLISNSYGDGWELIVRSDTELNIALGYAPGVAVTYNGEPVDFRVRPDSNTARFTL